MSRRGKTESPARRPLRAPTHPGALLREDVLPAIGEAVAGAAKKLGVTRRHLHRILAEKAPISPEMAIRLGKFCGNLASDATGPRLVERSAGPQGGDREDTDREAEGGIAPRRATRSVD
jgi:addiction module HigA family antidote